MDLNIFGTQAVQSGSKGPLSGSNSALFGNNGLGGLGGLGGLDNMAFLETILGNLNTEGEIKTETNNQNLQGDVANDGVKKEKSDLALLQLALMGQDVDQTLDEKLSELKLEKLVQTEGNRVEQLTKLINHLTSGLPQQAGDETTIEDLVSRLNNRLEKLSASLDAFRNNDFSDEDAPFKLLIATGLNPAQLTRITSRIEEVENKLGRQLTIEDLIAGVGNIVPAPGDEDHEFSTTDALSMLLKNNNDTAEIKEDNKQKIEEEQTEDAHLATHAVLDNSVLPFASPNIEGDVKMAPGKVKNYDVQAILNLIAANKIAPTAEDTTILPEDGISPLPQSMSNSEFKALFGGKNEDLMTAPNVAAKLITGNITPHTAVPALPMTGDLTMPMNWTNNSLSQQALNDALGFDIQTGTPFSQTMQAAHSITMAQSAGQSHPGTGMVAAQMTKAAQSGETKGITLQLDPPELGRVEVRMEFGADKKVKAHLIIEKPETYLMLQRDAAALDRALQDAGMDTGSDALNYEMAGENYNFGDDKNGRNNNSGTENASHSNDEIEEKIIETTMNWNVNPDTGHVHYNIMA